MIDIREIRKFNEDLKKKKQITADSIEAEKLRARMLSMMNCSKTKDEVVKLHEDIEAFFKSSPSEKDKAMVLQYSESVAMLYDAVEKGLLK